MQKEISGSAANGEMNTNVLLNPDELAALQVFTSSEAPFRQRAQALLAIDQGATQSEAAQASGLTLGQVRYWLGKFRESRLAIFPELPSEQVHVTSDTLATAGEELSDVESATGESSDKTSKKKKSKKAKKTKTKKETNMAKGKKQKKKKNKNNKPAKKSNKKKKKK